MSTFATEQASLSGISLGGALRVPLTDFAQSFTLSFGVGDSVYQLEAALTGEPVVLHDRFIAEFTVDDDVVLILTFIGERSEDESQFLSGWFSLDYKITGSRPRAHFVASTLMAVCGLAGKIEIPELVKTDLHLDVPPSELSKLLWRRQVAFRLMVIEKATGVDFLLPSVISEREVERIAFVYHAIVDRSFVWPGRSFNASIPATPEDAAYFEQLVQSPKWTLPVEGVSETVLGQTIDLGRGIVIIEDAVITNPDRVREQLAVGDGCQVALELHSLSGQDKYEFIEIPYASNVSWEPKIQALIYLEPYLDAAITTRYHALAAATLEGLTEEEKKGMTSFPDLDEAFIIDADGEHD